MTPNFRLRISTLGILLLVGALAGCTNSDVLTTEPGQVQLTVIVEPAGSPKYEIGVVKLTQVNFRPVDPQADAALGPEPYNFLTNPFDASLTDPLSADLDSAALSDGLYRIVSLKMQEPRITDFDPPADGSCLNGVLARTNGVLPPREVGAIPVIDVTGFDPADVTFRVTRNRHSTLRLVINGTTFVSLFETAFVCQSTGTCFQPSPPQSAPCMNRYNPLTADQLLPLFSFQFD